MLRLQLSVLRSERGFARMRDAVSEIAGMLEEKAAIPMVRDQLVLIAELQTDEWWQDVNVTSLELARKRLRGLVKLIDRRRRKPIYTNFEDEMGAEAVVDLLGQEGPGSFERFRSKARAFLAAHRDHLTIHKLRRATPLTRADLQELERMLTESGVARPEDLRQAKDECRGLGLFVRSLLGLDRESAKQAFSGFLDGKTFGANQIEFVNLIVDHLTERGVMEPRLLYESPFTDISPRGPDELFSPGQLDELLCVLGRVNSAAVAA